MEEKTTETTDETKSDAPIVEHERDNEDDDLEAKIKALEDEKAKLIEGEANYKMAYLKERSKRRDESSDEDESTDDRMRRIANEALAESRLAEIAREQDTILKKALKENKELKLAQLNKNTTPPASMGTHSEGSVVKDNLISEEQMKAFKARGWNDKDIERYKKNLVKYGGVRI